MTGKAGCPLKFLEQSASRSPKSRGSAHAPCLSYYTGQTPEMKAPYRVLAERADMSSLPSLPVTVYGSPVTLVLQKAA